MKSPNASDKEASEFADLYTERWVLDLVAKGVKRDVWSNNTDKLPKACSVKYTVGGFIAPRYKKVVFDPRTNRENSTWVKCKKSCYIVIEREQSETLPTIKMRCLELPSADMASTLSFASLGSMRDYGRNWRFDLSLWCESFEQIGHACDLYLANNRRLTLIIRLTLAVDPNPGNTLGPYQGLYVITVRSETTSYLGWPVPAF